MASGARWQADLHTCVELHAAVYWVLLPGGLGRGLAAGLAILPWSAAAAPWPFLWGAEDWKIPARSGGRPDRVEQA